MLKQYNRLSPNVRKKLLLSVLFLGTVAFSFASMGDGGNKSKTSSPSVKVAPAKITNSFTLKARPSYRGSITFNEVRTKNFLQLNSVLTYQKGNTTYILPYKHRVSVAAGKSNLQVINLKVKLSKN